MLSICQIVDNKFLNANSFKIWWSWGLGHEFQNHNMKDGFLFLHTNFNFRFIRCTFWFIIVDCFFESRDLLERMPPDFGHLPLLILDRHICWLPKGTQATCHPRYPKSLLVLMAPGRMSPVIHHHCLQRMPIAGGHHPFAPCSTIETGLNVRRYNRLIWPIFVWFCGQFKWLHRRTLYRFL